MFMNPGLSLLVAYLAQLAAPAPSHAPKVFRSVAPDGTIVFSDRPAGSGKKDWASSVQAIKVPTVNVVESVTAVLPGDLSHSPADSPQPERVQTRISEPSLKNRQHCEVLRQELAELWNERRRGYLAERGVALKTLIRAGQNELKQHCGQWR